MTPDVEKTATKIHGYMFDNKIKRLGRGEPGKEKGCPEFTAYMYCQGYWDIEKKIATLPQDSTVADAKAAFGRKMRQQKVSDEDLYELDPTEPLWRHSSNCKISLVFQYNQKEEVTSAATATGNLLNNVTKCTMKGIGSLWKSATGGNGDDSKSNEK